MLIPLIARSLFLCPHGLRILAQAESATAHTYHALALTYSGKGAETLEAISRKEYAHAKQLRQLLGWDPETPEMTKPHPAERDGAWSPKTRWALGLSTLWSWRILFGPSLFKMRQEQALRVIGLIEGLHIECYQAMAIAASDPHQKRVFGDIANDELTHQIWLASSHPLDPIAIRTMLLLPLACLVFLLFDWPKIKSHPSL